MSILPDWNNEPEQWLTAQNVEAKKLLSNPLLQKDVWRTIEDLGLTVSQHQKILTINFKSIQQDWLKLLIKWYVLIKSKSGSSANTINSYVAYLAHFSRFISSKSIVTPEQINNQLFEEFDYYLCSLTSEMTGKPLAQGTISNCWKYTKSFLDLCRQEGWLEINTYFFETRHKRAYPKNNKIKYIPEEVWQQLDEHLHYLPEPLQRMILVIRGTGLRAGELLNLPLDCLRQRDKQWRLRFLTEKYLVEDELPICQELVILIKEQQEYIKHHFGDSYHNLFNSNNPTGNHQYRPAPTTLKLAATS